MNICQKINQWITNKLILNMQILVTLIMEQWAGLWEFQMLCWSMVRGGHKVKLMDFDQMIDTLPQTQTLRRCLTNSRCVPLPETTKVSASGAATSVRTMWHGGWQHE
ncbi:MAG: hypothetical protein JNIBNLAF_01279 [Nitrosomonas europaea]|nr:hypothetical protein [Nitrosomonas europaea]